MKLILCYKIFLFIILIAFPGILNSQDRKSLEGEKKINIEKLKYTRKLLDSNKEDKKKNLSNIYILNRGIEYRKNLIRNYELELDFINSDIEYLNVEIDEGKQDIEKLKNSYANIVKASYRNLDNEFWLMYILSSEDINQSYRRYKYLKYLNEFRKDLYSEILNRNEFLAMQIDSLIILRIGKESTLTSIESEKNRLLSSQNIKLGLQKEFLQREEELLKQIKQREEIQLRIEREIRLLIEEEARIAREANRVNALTPAERIIDGNFGNNKGGLPWPTEQGIITGKFGERDHPILSGIIIKSNGIDISTTEESKVRAIFKGEVTKVIAILGANFTVIIKHGNYRTVYQNLISVDVKAGDMVEIKEYIGDMGVEDNKVVNLHFELWREKDALNPELWLSK
ncbi:MAG: peptidoglycan DD-metalloendopeptidase family protein [Bacteroidales bacterium]|nr:peptidoglycan DD-metalloendopeptidase family protein [Bacteroidales bacterium]